MCYGIQNTYMLCISIHYVYHYIIQKYYVYSTSRVFTATVVLRRRLNVTLLPVLVRVINTVYEQDKHVFNVKAIGI